MKKLATERGLEEHKVSPPSCLALLKRFQNNEIFPTGKKLEFSGVGGKDVYNISKPFFIDGEPIIAGRVEARHAWAESEIVFFRDEKGLWAPIYGAPTFKLEDSQVIRIGSEIIVEGVEVYPRPSAKYPENLEYQTVFYRGRDLSSLKKFAVGPELMKDIILTPLSNGHIGVFTRPQGAENGKGKIGFVELTNLKEINPKNLLRARIIQNQFSPEEWGGVNDAHAFKNWVYVLGHIAYEDKQNAKHYYAMSFVYYINSHKASEIKIIATRKNFPPGEAKTPKHEDIVFPRGLTWHRNNIATLYVGLSDAESHSAELPSKKIGIANKPISYIFKNAR